MAQIYDHYFCNFETFDEPIQSEHYINDDSIEKFIFIHGRCKGDLLKPNLSYKPLLRTILSHINNKYNKKAIIYMPEYHEYIGLEPYEPWSLKLGPISRELTETVLWQISKWKHKKFSFITNSWGCWHTMKLINNKSIKNYVNNIIFIAPVFNCWMIEQKQKYILSNNENNIEICVIVGSNDMQCNNDSKNGGVEQCILKWFHKKYLRVITIEGGTHGGIYDAIPNAKWNRRKWVIGASTQQYFDLFADNNENKVYKDKVSVYEEPELPKCMNEQQYRNKIADNIGMFLYGNINMKSMVVKVKQGKVNKLNYEINVLSLIDSLIDAF
eukprot:350924_1